MTVGVLPQRLPREGLLGELYLLALGERGEDEAVRSGREVAHEAERVIDRSVHDLKLEHSLEDLG